jgi:Rrf2 family protein
MFSKACEYGIRATLYIANQSLQNRRVSLMEIAKAVGTPEAFTAKILQQLVKTKIVESLTGPSGGFIIDKKKISKIMLSQIVTAIDGRSIYNGCGLGLKKCNAKKPCPVHDKFAEIRNNLKLMLETTSVEELTRGVESGVTYLTR